MTEPPTQQPTLKSQRLISGRYRLRRVIGRGAMGVVWLAYDEVLHRAVAVKEVQLPPGMPTPEANEARERTLREARAIAALTHPNVVAVHDVARQGVEPFVVMELVPGRSLAQFTSKAGTLDSEQAAAVADALAAGLEAAHRRGITHRDVKPGNVLLGEDGQVKLTDFGISRNVSEVTMTSNGLILGTPAYIAPEVASGDPVTAAADLWGLGATLFAVVEGRPPYDLDSPLDTINEVVHGEVPRPAEDAPLADVIAGLMVKDPAQRMNLVEVRRRIRGRLPEPGAMVFPPDDEAVEDDGGPADNKPTSNLASGGDGAGAAPESGPPPLAADPGPLPFVPTPPPMPTGAPVPLAQAPGPLPFVPPPVHKSAPPPLVRRPVRRRRSRLVVAVLLLVGAVLFAAAASGGFVAARTLAGQGLRPPPDTPPATVSPPTTGTRPPVPALTQTTAQAAATAGTSDDRFSVAVPQGWTEFVEQRGSDKLLPPSTAVLWINADGTQELSVELFRDWTADDSYNYAGALQEADPNGNAIPLLNSTAEFRTTITARSIRYRSVPDGDDMWVVSLTVPTVQEKAGSDLFARIQGTFSHR